MSLHNSAELCEAISITLLPQNICTVHCIFAVMYYYHRALYENVVKQEEMIVFHSCFDVEGNYYLISS